jgi:hypothetical protein
VTVPGPDTVTSTASFVRAGQVEVTVSGPGTVTSQPAGITCGGTNTSCSSSFSGDGVVTLSAGPPGALFLGWGGACTQYATAPCVVASSAESGVTATFGVPPASGGSQVLAISHGSLAVASAPDYLGPCAPQVICTASVPAGSTVTLTAGGAFQLNPLAPLSQVVWYGSCVGAWPVCQLSVDGPTAVAVAPVPGRGVAPYAFASRAAQRVTLTMSGHGAVYGAGHQLLCKISAQLRQGTCSVGYLYAGDKVTLTARPAVKGGKFVGWYGGLLCNGRNPVCKATYEPGGGLDQGLRFSR